MNESDPYLTEKAESIDRERHRMALFVQAYVKSMHLNLITPLQEAKAALAAFDAEFPPK